jgi:two-component system, cell cycle response regulator
MNEQIAQRIRQCNNLPSLPAIAVQVLELAQKEDADIGEIARIISKDPALSGKILRTVNSSFYARSQNVSTISHALVILGLQSVKTLVLGFSLVTNLSKTKSQGFHHVTYWRRSIYSATAARVIAQKIGVLQQEEAFLAALLNDIGMLVLDTALGDQYGCVHAQVKSHAQLMSAEQQMLGTTHAEVGGMIAAQWKLPPILTEPIAHHHTPQAVTDPQLKKLAEITWVAGLCAEVFATEDAAPAIAEVRKAAAELYKMSEADCDALLDEIGKRTKEVAPLFEINLGGNMEYEAILKRANEALVEITLQSQQQASTLQQQNLHLQQVATTDGLTGLSNRARFDEIATANFAEALLQKAPISLLMIDVDKFKTVNDRFGHPTGDQVLRVLGKLLKSAARQQDLLARYGGEEMVLVLPGTPRMTAAAIAESIRRAIAEMPIKAGAVTIPVTVSIGVATYDAESPMRQLAQLLKAADLALYNAKNSGRNCVKVFALKSLQPATSAA